MRAFSTLEHRCLDTGCSWLAFIQAFEPLGQKIEKGPPMNAHAFARQCLAHRYTLITRSECGCAASILHNAQESPEAATRVMIDGMRQGRRVECLPALVAAEIPWTCTIHQLEGAQESAA